MPSRGTIVKITALFALVGAGVYLRGSPWSPWNRFHELSLGVAVAVYVAAVVGGRLRDAFIVVASVGLGLTVAEAYALVVSAPAIETSTPRLFGVSLDCRAGARAARRLSRSQARRKVRQRHL
jgi:hypothetical protein